MERGKQAWFDAGVSKSSSGKRRTASCRYGLRWSSCLVSARLPGRGSMTLWTAFRTFFASFAPPRRRQDRPNAVTGCLAFSPGGGDGASRNTGRPVFVDNGYGPAARAAVRMTVERLGTTLATVLRD